MQPSAGCFGRMYPFTWQAAALLQNQVLLLFELLFLLGPLDC